MSERSDSGRARGPFCAGCALALGLALPGGCAVGPDFHRPAPPVAARYGTDPDPLETIRAGDTVQRFTAAAEFDADWWHLFHSPALDAVVAEALAHNPGLDAARASLRQSEDALRSGYGIFYPGIGGDAAAKRERYSPANLGQSASGSIFNLFTVSASVSYALDLFGGQRRLVESLHAQMDVAQANERAARLTLAVNVANTVIARSAYQAERDAASRLVTLETEQLHLTETQAQAGTVPYANVLAVRSLLAASQAALPALEQRIAQTEDLLSVLAGHTPAEWQAPPAGIDAWTLPADLPVSLPSELVRRRPDVLAAEALAHAASAGIGVATAAMLPSIALNGTLAANSNSAARLFPANGSAWSIGADAAVPVFQGGTLWYRRRAAVENYRAAGALYRQTVLAAFAQVADTLRALDHDAAVLAALEQARTDAEEALRLRQANYAAGLANYLDVITADVAFGQARIAELEATAQRAQDTVALYAALGGGWWNSPAPAAQATAP